MPEQEIDLDREIKELEKRREELYGLWEDTPGNTPEEKEKNTLEIEDMLPRIDEKILILKDTRNNRQASQVIIRGLTQEEKDQMNRALAALSIPIQRDQNFQVIMTTLTEIFKGVELIASKA